jgi:hypothetical protein
MPSRRNSLAMVCWQRTASHAFAVDVAPGEDEGEARRNSQRASSGCASETATFGSPSPSLFAPSSVNSMKRRPRRSSQRAQSLLNRHVMPVMHGGEHTTV